MIKNFQNKTIFLAFIIITITFISWFIFSRYPQNTSLSPLKNPAKHIIFLHQSIKKKPSDDKIILQPLGDNSFSSDWLIPLRQRLQKIFHRIIIIRPLIPLPSFAFYPLRQRYRAERICTYLATMKRSKNDFIVGLTQVDISTETREYIDHAVHGLADKGGPSGIISNYRIRKKISDKKALLSLWSRLIIHEIGHLFGLSHCSNKHCVMFNAHNDLRAIQRTHLTFCKDCQRRLLEKRKGKRDYRSIQTSREGLQ